MPFLPIPSSRCLASGPVTAVVLCQHKTKLTSAVVSSVALEIAPAPFKSHRGMWLPCDLEPRAVVHSPPFVPLSHLKEDVTHRGHTQHWSPWASAVGLPETMHGPQGPHSRPSPSPPIDLLG